VKNFVLGDVADDLVEVVAAGVEITFTGGKIAAVTSFTPAGCIQAARRTPSR
jgi:hypothetical protein